LDVPQGLVDAGDRAHQDGPAPVEAAAVHHGPQVLDVGRVLADQVVGELLDGGADGGRAAFDHGFSPAGHALVGLDLHEGPAGRDLVGGDGGDLHACSSSRWWRSHRRWRVSAVVRTSSAPRPGVYRVVPMPAPAAPAASQAGRVSASMPPTGRKAVPGGTVAAQAFMPAMPMAGAGKIFRARAPACWAVKTSVAVATPGGGGRPSSTVRGDAHVAVVAANTT